MSLSGRRTVHPGIAVGRTAILFFSTILLAGCGQVQVASTKTPRIQQPVSGGTFRMLQEVPISLDPSESYSIYEAIPVNQMFDNLVSLDAAMRVVPGLADRWTISRDGMTYIFSLRQGVRFHDGSRLTAHDVLFSFKRILDPALEQRGQEYPYLMVLQGARDYSQGVSSDLPGITAPDDGTVVFRLVHPYPTFLEVLTLDGLKIVPEETVRTMGIERFRREPVGTGPFKFQSWDDDRLKLVAYQDYFGGTPYLDSVELLFRKEGENDYGTTRFMNRELDLVEPMTEDLPTLADDPSVSIHRYQEMSLSFLGFGMGNPPLDRLEIRQAIAYALDRESLVADSPIFRRTAVGILPPGVTSYSPSMKALPHDPERARQLLRSAGFGEDRPVPPVTLVTDPGGGAAGQRLLQRIRRDLADVGIPLEVKEVSWPDLSRMLEQGTAPAFLLAWIADLTDPDAFLRGLLASDGASNDFGFDDEQCRRLLEQGTMEVDPVQRSRTYRKLERRILQLAPMVPLYHTLGVIAVRKTVHGLEPNPMGMANAHFESVWIEQDGV